MGNPKRQPETFGPVPDEDHPQFVTAVARAFSILRCFEHGEASLGNRDIARRTGLPKPTVSRLTFTLSSLGYLSYLPELEKYALGTGVLSLGHAFMKANDVVAIARPLMQELARYTQAAVMLAQADGLRMVLLEVCQGDPTFQMKLEVGARVPHGSTALGRADLAARPLEVFHQRLAMLQEQIDPALWPKVRAGIVRAREDYENYGFCMSLGDWNPDVFAIGVPMASSDRSRVLAFNCSGRVSLMTREKLLQDFGPRLLALRNRVYELTNGRF
jgi:DNA-binding IclR family transcriptional regulator